MKTQITVVLLGALFAFCAFAEEPQIIFRDHDLKFRLQYPKKWVVLKPVGQNVRFSIKSPEGQAPATCNVTVRKMGESMSMSQTQINAEINEKKLTFEEAEALILGALPNAQLVEFKQTKINNFPGQFGIVERSNENLDSKIFSREMKFVTFTPGYAWHLMCGSPGSSSIDAMQTFKQRELIFRKILGTFTFEPWE